MSLTCRAQSSDRRSPAAQVVVRRVRERRSRQWVGKEAAHLLRGEDLGQALGHLGHGNLEGYHPLPEGDGEEKRDGAHRLLTLAEANFLSVMRCRR